jgi:hypothetical protein
MVRAPVLTKRFISFPKHPDPLWSPTGFLFIEDRPSSSKTKWPVMEEFKYFLTAVTHQNFIRDEVKS